MPVSRRDSGDTRVIAHLDLDCFYVQVEQRKRPELRGKPVAVVQYNPWKGGGLIAVSYEARQCGVLRCMRGDDAKKLCPDIELLRAPWAEGNAPLNWYRDAGTEVVTVLSRGGVCERASIDEVYLDITEAAAARLLTDFPFAIESLSEEARKMHILGLEEDGNANAMAAVDWLCQKDAPRCDALLACGAVIIAELRDAVLAETQFTCSAGVAHNKMLAKLTSSMHTPAQQTVIPASYVPTLLASLPLKKIQRLGGKLGKALQEDLGVKTPADLLPFSQLKLQELYGLNAGAWLWNMARGMNGDEVQSRVLTKSHSCSRAFPGPKALTSITSVMHWLGELGDRLQDQLDLDFELHNRKAKLLVFHATVQLRGGSQPVKKFPSKSCPLRYGKEKVLADARLLFERGLRDFCPSNQSLSPAKGSGSNGPNNWAVTLLSIGAGDISAIPTGVNPISSFFAAPSRSTTTPETILSTTSDLEEPGSGQHPCQSTKEFEIGSTSRTPSSNDLDEQDENEEEEPADFISDGSESLNKPGSFEEPARCGNIFLTDGDDGDVQCTPTFGRIGSPVKLSPKSQLQLFDDRHSLQIDDLNPKTLNPSEDAESPTLIQCSPVEEYCVDPEATLPRLPAVVNPPEGPFPLDSWTCLGIGHETVSFETDGGVAAVSPRLPLSTETQQRVSVGGISGSTTTDPISPAKPSSVPKLKELWQRNGKRSGSKWECYKQEEIDEEVLAQLPAAIQRELRNSWKPNPKPLQRPSKRPSISDFFPSSK